MIKIPDRLFYKQDFIDKYVKVIGDIICKNYEKWKKNRKKVNKTVEMIFEGNGKTLKENVKDIITDVDFVKSAKIYKKGVNKQITKIIKYSYLNVNNKKATENFGSFGVRHALLTELGVEVCPYCNRQYITSYKEKNTNDYKTTADLDHYRPKSKYPLLALSLYNFIPSCQICNSRMKIDSELETVYPFFENFGNNCIFKLVINDNVCDKKLDNELKYIKGEFDYKVTKLELKNVASDESLHKKIDNSLRVFKLEEVYQIHTKKACDLLMKKRLFDNEEFRSSIENVLLDIGYKSNNSDSVLNGDEFDWLIYGLNWNEDGENINEPLSKLIYDIVKR